MTRMRTTSEEFASCHFVFASKTIFPHSALAPATGAVFPPIRPLRVLCPSLLWLGTVREELA